MQVVESNTTTIVQGAILYGRNAQSIRQGGVHQALQVGVMKLENRWTILKMHECQWKKTIGG